MFLRKRSGCSFLSSEYKYLKASRPLPSLFTRQMASTNRTIIQVAHSWWIHFIFFGSCSFEYASISHLCAGKVARESDEGEQCRLRLWRRMWRGAGLIRRQGTKWGGERFRRHYATIRDKLKVTCNGVWMKAKEIRGQQETWSTNWMLM